MASSADKYTAYDPNAPLDEGPGPVGYLALVLAWAVPGLGHMLIGQKARGAVFCVSIHALFALGLLIGGIRVINPPEQAIWTYTQFLAGWPMIVANRVEQASRYELGDRSYPTERPEYKGQLGSLFEQQTPPNETLEQKQARTIQFIRDHPSFAVHPKLQDLGSVYCGIAGMLNLLVMFDVLLRITGSVREDPAEIKKRQRAQAAAAASAPATPPTAPAAPEAAP